MVKALKASVKASKGDKLNLVFQPALLLTESPDDFHTVRAALESEVKPSGAIECILLDDIANLVWESLRLRQVRAGIINRQMPDAVERILLQLNWQGDPKWAVKPIAWLKDPSARAKIREWLESLNLAESTIEAEAFRKVAADLEIIDRMLASVQARRNKTLALLDHRRQFAQQLRQSSDQIIERQVLRLEDQPRKTADAA